MAQVNEWILFLRADVLFPGPSAKCFNDLQVFDPDQMAWIETASSSPDNGEDASASESGNEANLGGVGGGGGGGGGGGCSGSDSSSSHLTGVGDGDANPNDNPNTEQIVILGQCPGRRAGHTTTVANRRLLVRLANISGRQWGFLPSIFLQVFGGSFGSEYLNDFLTLDTGTCNLRFKLNCDATCLLLDPPPPCGISLPSSTQVLQQSLAKFVNDEEFSDVSFVRFCTDFVLMRHGVC